MDVPIGHADDEMIEWLRKHIYRSDWRASFCKECKRAVKLPSHHTEECSNYEEICETHIPERPYHRKHDTENSS